MNQQEPKFLLLESPSEITFWPESQKRALILFRTPSQFLAFGVLGDSDTVVFIASGKVGEHLAAFLSRMEQEGAKVEFHSVPPPQLTALWEEYGAADGPYESKNGEPPPPPPPGIRPTDHELDA